ncbi:MAG: toxin-antitoxin system HicB family antitoxin [Epsilonproteobacteria bacterium]|nr:MAG: toxin-antitoxin system HicB family antitoxin [Campylobacterota bacterium]
MSAKKAKKKSKKELKHLADLYAYKVFYSEDDKCFVATCAEFASLSGLGEDRYKALEEVENVVIESLEDMNKCGEELPSPLSTGKYSGKISLRLSPEKHRELALESQFENISMNQLIANKL